MGGVWLIWSEQVGCLVVFRVDDYKPITRSTFDRNISFPQFTSYLKGSFWVDVEEDPLSFEALAKRAGFVSADDEGS